MHFVLWVQKNLHRKPLTVTMITAEHCEGTIIWRKHWVGVIEKPQNPFRNVSLWWQAVNYRQQHTFFLLLNTKLQDIKQLTIDSGCDSGSSRDQVIAKHKHKHIISEWGQTKKLSLYFDQELQSLCFPTRVREIWLFILLLTCQIKTFPFFKINGLQSLFL